jgi:predicted component of type VI protein secretion system
MLPLVVRVDRLKTKESTRHVFRSSPVRIGRNKLNDLPLEDPFVSLWHGMLQFDGNSIQYLDLASTNGSELNGERAQPNTLIPLGDEADLLIGPLKLHISRSAEPIDAPAPRSMTLFDVQLPQGGAEGAPPPDDLAVFQAPSPTVYWQGAGAPIAATAMPAPTLLPQNSGTAPAQAAASIAASVEAKTGRSFSEESWPATTANALLPRYMKYRDAWDKLNKQLLDAISSVPAARRTRALQLLQGRLPALANEQDFRSLLSGDVNVAPTNGQVPFADPAAEASSAPGSGIGHDTLPGTRGMPQPGAIGLGAPLISVSSSSAQPHGLEGATVLDIQVAAAAARVALPATAADTRATSLLNLFAETYVPGSKRIARDPEQFLRQLSAVLEAFAQAFIELRRGQEEFNKQMAISAAASSSLKLGSGTARDVLRQLLDTGPEAPQRVRDLTSGFADVMVHQVALLSGIREGVRALLGRLHPEVFSGGGGGNRLTSTLVSPVRSLLAWKNYVSRFQELTEEERATEGVLFGPEFAFAYARIVGGPLAGKRPGKKS